MDLLLLDPKELAVELKIRDIDPDSPDAVRLLEERLEIEEVEPEKRPQRLHDTKNPQPELNACTKALEDLNKLYAVVTLNLTDTSVRQLKTRLWHWRGRTSRLADTSPTYRPEAALLIPRFDQLMESAAALKVPEEEADISPGTVGQINDVSKRSPVSEPIISYRDFFSNNVPKQNMSCNRFGNHTASGHSASSVQHSSSGYYRPHGSLPVPKWNIFFDGSNDGLEITEFIFRMETLATNDQYPLGKLVGVLSNFLTGLAANWYWVHLQKFPSISWRDLKMDMLKRFRSYSSERETRRAIESRRQGNKESFSTYLLEVERLNGRLHRPFCEDELLEIVRDNMDPALQSATSTSLVTSTEDLRQICQRLEKLWFKSGHDPRQLTQTRHVKSCSAFDQLTGGKEPIEDDFKPQVAAVGNYRDPSDRTQYEVCWNCRVLGHRYQECLKPHLGIFCYGCGQSGVLKPNCSSCSRKAENRSANAGKPGTTRSANSWRIPRKLTEDAASNTEPILHR